jgi:hypothetical protein
MIWEMAKASIKGKWRPYTIPVHRPDPDDDDCQVIKVFDPMPLSFTYPLRASENTASAKEPAADRGKKRAAEEAAVEPKQKKVKKTTRKVYAPPKPKQKTLGSG